MLVKRIKRGALQEQPVILIFEPSSSSFVIGDGDNRLFLFFLQRDTRELVRWVQVGLVLLCCVVFHSRNVTSLMCSLLMDI